MIKKNVFKKLISVCLVLVLLVSSLIVPGMGQAVYAQKTKSENLNTVSESVYGELQEIYQTMLNQQEKIYTDSEEVNKNRIIVKYKDLEGVEKVNRTISQKIKPSELEKIKEIKSRKIHVYKLGDRDNIKEVMDEFRKDNNVEYVQEDTELKFLSELYEPGFCEQWGLENYGQEVYGQQGVNNMDINVVEAWQQTKGSSNVIVGILDTGMDLTHEDLKDNIYINAREIPDNGIDDDSNGYIDDVCGWDFYNEDNTVFDSSRLDMHGTHIAGIIAGSENEKGILGVAPNVKVIPLKFIDGSFGYTSDAIEAIEYCRMMDVDIVNCSWGGIESNQALKDAMSDSGILFICAAGNMGIDSSITPIYPASFNLSNTISVAAIDNRGYIAPFSNYGDNISVVAPGVNIYSTLPGNNYGMMSGTSMAAPMLTGVAALLKSFDSNLSVDEIVQRIKNNVVVSYRLDGKITSGGRIDAGAAIRNVPPTPEVWDTSTPELSTLNNNENKDLDEIINAPKNNSPVQNGKVKKPLIVDQEFTNVQQRELYSTFNNGLDSVNYNVEVQSISPLSYIYETEPNDTSSTGMPVSFGSIYCTVTQDNPSDWFIVNLEANKQYTISLKGLQTGNDLDLFLYKPDLSYAGDSMTLGNADENITICPTVTGYYYINTYCFSYAFSGDHSYQLLVYPDDLAPDSYEPNDSQNTAKSITNNSTVSANININTDEDWFVIDAVSAGRLTVTLDNIPYGCDYDVSVYDERSNYIGGSYNTNSLKENASVLLNSGGKYYVRVYSYTGASPSINYYMKAVLSTPDIFEINDNIYEAIEVESSNSVLATLDNKEDVDWFKVNVDEQCNYVFELQNIPTDRDYDVYIYNAEGSYVAGSCFGGNADEYINISMSTGIYYVKVYSYYGSSDSLRYRFSAYKADSLTLAVPYVRANAADIIQVPVNIQNLPLEGLCSFDFSLDYDKNALTYLGYEPGTLMSGSQAQIQAEDTSRGLNVLFWDNSENFSYPLINSGEIIRLNFQVNSNIADGAFDISYNNGWSFGRPMQDGKIVSVKDAVFKKGILMVGSFGLTSIYSTVQPESVEIINLSEVAGDVDGDEQINSIDFAYMRKYLLGMITEFPSSQGEEMADVNCDGSINSIDFAMLRQYLLGMITEFPNPDISANLIGYYPLDETSGNIALNQVSTNYGILNNFGGNQWVKGTIDGGLCFDGIDDEVDLSNGDYLRTAFSERTIAMWVKAEDNSSVQELYDEGDLNNGISLRLNGSNLEGIIKSNGNQYTVNYQNFGTYWHHVVFAFDGVNRNCKLYIDGSLVESISNISFGEVPYHGDNCGLGNIVGYSDSFGNTSSSYFGGIVDDVRIYDRALVHREVTTLYKLSTDIVLDYALFSVDKSTPLTVEASDTLINGNIHTNNDFNYSGNNLSINGLCKSVGQINTVGTLINIGSKVQNASTLGVPDLIEDISHMAQENSVKYDTSQEFSNTEINLSQSIIVNGDVSFNSSLFSGFGYILATGNITYNAPFIGNDIQNKTVMCSENGDITIKGSTCVINGVIYAPKGTVLINSTDFTLNGRIIANKILIQCNNFKVTSSDDDIGLIVKESDLQVVPTKPEISVIDEENGIKVLWNINPIAIGYKLKKGTTPDNLIEVTTNQIGSYFDADVIDNNAYYYTVTANYKGMNLNSDTICIRHNADDDHDGITNAIEAVYDTDPNKADTDDDGINDNTELGIGTDPLDSDTDKDGLNDGEELNYNCNPLFRDSDEDGLIDGYEANFCNTKPDLKDTDNDGNGDANEDYDMDGLTNLQEYRFRSNSSLIDTDEDGLTDGDEVNQYGTDPINPDTDGDGVEDGEEVRLGLNTDNPDSDNDGVLDEDESFTVTVNASQDPELSSSDNFAVPEVTVTLKAGSVGSLNIEKDGTVRSINENNARVGLPVDITCDGSIEQATISFKIDTSILTESSLDQLGIYWYDKTDNCVKPMPTQRDYVNNLLSTVTDHFSTYFVMDNNKKAQELGLSGDDIINNVNGVADITFVLDTTGSMGEEIDSVKNYINNFVDTISQENVYLRLGIVSYYDYIKYGDVAATDHGWFTDVEMFKQELSTIDTGDGQYETPVDALEMARRMGFGSNASKFIILVTDEGYYNDNRYGVTNMDEEIQLLVNDNIITYVITTPSLASEVYQNLYTLTGGEYGNINDDFSVVLNNISNKIASTVNNGYWILLSDLSLVKLEKDPSLGDVSIDTDGDGIKDLEELMGTTTITIGSKSYTCWKFNSNPSKADSDGDGYNDSLDSSPNQYDLFSNVTITPKEGLAGNLYTVNADTKLSNAVVLFQLNSGKWYTYEEAQKIQNFTMDLVRTDSTSGISSFSKELPILDPGIAENSSIRKFRIAGKDEFDNVLKSQTYEVTVTEAIRLTTLNNSDNGYYYVSAKPMDLTISDVFLEIKLPGAVSNNSSDRVSGYLSDEGIYYFALNKLAYGNGTFEIAAYGYDMMGNIVAASNKLTLDFKGNSILKPAFSPKGGNYDDSLTVSIETSIEEGEIYYTLDGTDPYDVVTKTTSASAKLYEPAKKVFITSGSATIKARVFYGYNVSELVETTYIIDGTNSVLRKFGIDPLDGVYIKGKLYTYSDLIHEKPLLGVPHPDEKVIYDQPGRRGMYYKGGKVRLLQLIYRKLGFEISDSHLGLYDSWQTIGATRAVMAFYNIGWRGTSGGSDSDIGPTMWNKIIAIMDAYGDMDPVAIENSRNDFKALQDTKIAQALKWEEEEKERARRLKEELEKAQISESIPTPSEVTKESLISGEAARVIRARNNEPLANQIIEEYYLKVINSDQYKELVNSQNFLENLQPELNNLKTMPDYIKFNIARNMGLPFKFSDDFANSNIIPTVDTEFYYAELIRNQFIFNEEFEKAVLIEEYIEEILKYGTITGLCHEIVKALKEVIEEDIKGGARQILLGNWCDKVTLSGTIGQVLLGLFGLDLPADIRDVAYDITHWEWSLSHGVQFAIDVVGLLPVIGVIKNSDEVKTLIKGSKTINKVANALEVIKGYFKGKLDSIFEYVLKTSDNGSAIVCKTIDGTEVVIPYEDLTEIQRLCLKNGCFTGDMLVLTKVGLKRIDQIQEGDYVLSQNIDTRENQLKRVEYVYKKSDKTIVHLLVEDEEIKTTRNHLFYMEDGKWRAAENLRVGSKIYDADGALRQVSKIYFEELEEATTVYNLCVEDFHTYFVSESSLLVHNDCSTMLTEYVRQGLKRFDAMDATVTDALKMTPEDLTQWMDEVWATLSHFQRGEMIEAFLAQTKYVKSQGWEHIGRQKNGFFPVIDFWKGSEVVSLKTINPTLYSGRGYVDEMIRQIEKLRETKFIVSDELGIDSIDLNNTMKTLEIMVPKGTKSMFNPFIEELKEAGEGVKIVIDEF